MLETRTASVALRVYEVDVYLTGGDSLRVMFCRFAIVFCHAFLGIIGEYECEHE